MIRTAQRSLRFMVSMLWIRTNRPTGAILNNTPAHITTLKVSSEGTLNLPLVKDALGFTDCDEKRTMSIVRYDSDELENQLPSSGKGDRI